ncbi:MAG: carboxypeptidase regulatory-like domain-containing protein [Proteobacteria bacterium]|nr:carboxypeptidase regulatory-like domain-containing protein [Pseudomonadota bacterium]
MRRAIHGRWVAAAAAAVMLAAAGAAQAIPAPKAVTHGDATWVNGGVGKLEAEAMRHMASRYPVSMTFAKHNQGANEFVAGVKLRITDGSGKQVMDLGDSGPMLLLKVPDGKYTVRAEYEGHVKTQSLDVTAGHHEKLGFLWS